MRRMSKLVVMMLMFLIPAAAWSQVTTASIHGVVKDAKGQPLPGATIKAKHDPSGSVFGAISRIDGKFNVPNVRVGGPYTITVTFLGYRTESKTDVILALSQDLAIDFALEEEAFQGEEVKVTAERNNLISSSRTGAGESVSREQIDRLPTISRSIQDYARLSPQSFGTNIGSSENTGGSNIGGKNNRYNNIQVDGAVLNDVFGLAASGTPGGQANTQPISLDAIEEFQVSLAPYDIRLGGFTGGSINAITRSGNNTFIGSGYYFGRNEGLVGTSPDTVKKKLDDFSEFQGGFRVGGPVKKDKLFFFVNGEIKNRKDPRTVGFRGSGEAVEFNIPQSTMEEIIRISKEKYGYDPGSFGSYTSETKDMKLFLRMDYNLSEKHRLTLRHNYVNADLDRGITRNATTYTLTSQEYVFNSVQNSTVAQLNSSIGTTMANEARISVTTVRDKRDPSSDPFPQVEIFVGDRETAQFGIERSSQANSLDQDIIAITDNLSYFKGDHTFTVGTHNEIITYKNLFLQDFYGSYQFDDFRTAAGVTVSPDSAFEIGRPTRYRYSYSLIDGVDMPLAEFTSYQVGFYLQDQWKVSPKLTITPGLRFDIPMFPEEPLYNPKADSIFGVRTDEVPSGTVQFSPRLGFNYDITGNKDTQLRGGIGIFSGRTPGVWISNQYSNTGMDIARVDYRQSGTSNVKVFSPDPYNQPRPGDAGFPGQPITTVAVNVTDPDFKFPQVMRGNIALDRELPNGLVATVEYVYTKNINDIQYANLNIVDSDSTVFGDRPFYNFSRVKKSTAFTDVLLLSSSDKGHQSSLTFQLQKKAGSGEGFLRNMMGSVSYTLSEARDVNSGTSSTARSNWEFNVVPGDPNNPPEGRSSFEIRHRFLGTISQRFTFMKKWAATASFIYERRSGRPFSYIYNGDANGDGASSNDLLYVPETADDIVLSTNNWADLDNFISSDAILNDARGTIFERNTAREPAATQLDFRGSLEIPTMKAQKFELTFDVLNLPNLLNHDWGYQEYVSFQTYQLLRITGYSTAPATLGKPLVSFTKPLDLNKNGKADVEDIYSKDNLLSRWAVQLGVRYTF